MRLARGLGTVMGLMLAVQVAGAQETRCERGDTEVREVRFVGNANFADDELLVGIVTTPSSWLRRTTRYFGVRHCLAPREFPRDVERLRVFYRNHGFLEVQVDTIVTRVADEAVTIAFAIIEGEPILVDRVVVDGLEGVPEALAVERGLPASIGEPFDRYANRATLDTIIHRLRNTGYPEAEAFLGYDLRFLERRATVRFAVVPGPRRRLGEVRIRRSGPNGTPPEISNSAVRNLAGLSTGDLYRERQLERAKRLLYQSEAFASVEVRPLLATADSVLPVEIEVTEAALGNARFGAGMANLDCVRATAELTRHNIFQSASRLELRARVSKIGADQICPGLTNRDPYSQTLNYYVSTTVTQPFIFRTRFVPTYTLYQERRGEYRAFLREAPIGVSASFSRAAAARALNLGYSIELGRTEAQPALFCAVFNACVAADREALQRFQRLAVVSAATSYAQTDDAIDPSRGVVARADNPLCLQVPGLRRGARVRTLLPSTDRSIAGSRMTSSSRCDSGSVAWSGLPSQSTPRSGSCPRKSDSSPVGRPPCAAFGRTSSAPPSTSPRHTTRSASPVARSVASTSATRCTSRQAILGGAVRFPPAGTRWSSGTSNSASIAPSSPSY